MLCEEFPLMKKLVLAIIITTSSGQLSSQNEYFQHNPEWTVMEIRSQFYPCVEYDTATFYLNGDTIINTLTYKKLFARGTSRNMWWSPNPNMSCSLAPYNYPGSGYQGALRSVNTQVFYIQPTTTQEGLLYDFNLQVGSNLPFSVWTTTDSTVTVAAIDSVYTPYGYLKKFHFSTDTSQFVMEGALSSFGLYHYCDIMLDFTSYTMCYTLNDTAWWPVQGPNCNAVLLNAGEQTLNASSLQLIPNPATEFVEVQLTNAVVDGVELYDVRGQLAKSQTTTRINTAELAPGIYFVRVQSGRKVFTGKLIIE